MLKELSKWLIPIAALAGCSDAVDAGPAGSETTDTGVPGLDAAAAESGPGVVGPDGNATPLSCPAPGTPNNEKGLGGYCTTTSECAGEAGLRLCSKDVGSKDNWFCTAPCATDMECGTGQYCAHTPQGSGCVPLACSEDAGP